MRLFDTPGADANYDRWLTTTPEDRAHLPECNCEKCHDAHVENGDEVRNAIESPQDYQCCVDLVEAMMNDGEVCRTHPFAYVEPPTKKDPTMHCEECSPEYFK